ncbi:GMP/IMP nucleotidase [Pelagibaculum spongiae]|uniref:GMP/IMP nucleotidase n=1 Tax=Pelagibaculum spongiae TaxID=2080658 RepID=UPI001F4E07B9|nr:GMP/IMP nucleotidase [Pelagibaculum spongiae]
MSLSETSQVTADWSQIDTLLLDMDGTLLDLHFDNQFFLELLPDRMAQKHGGTKQQAKSKLQQLYHELNGTLDWYCLDYWSRRLDIDLIPMKQELKHLIGFRPGVEQCLKILGDKGIRRVLVTNAHPASLELKLDVTNLDDYLDLMVTAHQLGHPKEQQDFWHKLQYVEAFDPQRTLFIDDNIAVLKSAELYGIKHLRAIRQPDSQREQVNTAGFAAIDDFMDLL